MLTIFAFEYLLTRRHTITDSPDGATPIAWNCIISKHFGFRFISQISETKTEFYKMNVFASFSFPKLKIWTVANESFTTKQTHFIEFIYLRLRRNGKAPVFILNYRLTVLEHFHSPRHPHVRIVVGSIVVHTTSSITQGL
jgi:hypothetical protein